jgi:hypothetical protein
LTGSPNKIFKLPRSDSTLNHPRCLPSCWKERGSPHNVYLWRISRIEFWCGRQRMELLNHRELACYQCTKVDM